MDFVDISIVSNYVLAQSFDGTENQDNKIVMCFDFFLENYDKIPDSIINRFRNRFIKYLNKNFRNSKLANGKLNEIIEIFGINIGDLNTEELENTVLETYYLSYHLITIGYIVFRKLVTVPNITDLSRTILKDMFYRIKKISGDDKIRCFAETFICYVHDDAEICRAAFAFRRIERRLAGLCRMEHSRRSFRPPASGAVCRISCVAVRCI